MSFSLEWTGCQFHRVNDNSPLIATLSGAIASSNILYWNLFPALPEPGGLPKLYFVENIFGQGEQMYDQDIPLAWEISIDGGQFTPVDIQPDNTLSVAFSAGEHAFQLRISGFPEANQQDGYYFLQLDQEIVPVL